MDKIKTNNLNSVSDKIASYRLGDNLLVFDTIDYSDNIILNDSVFEGTILNRFAKTIKKGDDRIKVCANIIAQMLKEKEYEKAEDDSLVIHVRVGDIWGIDDKCNIDKRPILENILKKIKKTKFKKIYLVSAYSYSKGKYSSQETVSLGQRRSENFLKTIIESIPSDKICVIKSSKDVDEDFIFMATAKHLFITGKSCFAVSAFKINKLLK